jgi:hypothetical protein
MSRLLQWHSRALDNVHVSEAFDAARTLFFARARAERERIERERKERERRQTRQAAVPPPAPSPLLSSTVPASEAGATGPVESRSASAPAVVRREEAASAGTRREEKKEAEPPPARPWFEEMLVDHSARGGIASTIDDWLDEDEPDGRNGRALCDYDPLGGA